MDWEWPLAFIVGIVTIILWLLAFDPALRTHTRWQCFIWSLPLLAFELVMAVLHFGGFLH